jgi:hypothetical protein
VRSCSGWGTTEGTDGSSNMLDRVKRVFKNGEGSPSNTQDRGTSGLFTPPPLKFDGRPALRDFYFFRLIQKLLNFKIKLFY